MVSEPVATALGITVGIIMIGNMIRGFRRMAQREEMIRRLSR